jgi:hypothetical protein
MLLADRLEFFGSSPTTYDLICSLPDLYLPQNKTLYNMPSMRVSEVQAQIHNFFQSGYFRPRGQSRNTRGSRDRARYRRINAIIPFFAQILKAV